MIEKMNAQVPKTCSDSTVLNREVKLLILYDPNNAVRLRQHRNQNRNSSSTTTCSLLSLTSLSREPSDLN